MKGVAAVTGASRGIGRATALALAREGYQVFALGRTSHDLDALAGDSAGVIVPVLLDIAGESSRRNAVHAIMDATNGYGLDVLVNNAGYGQLGPLEEMPAEKLRRQLEVNVVGLLAFTQPFLPGMRERRRGWVVNLSSIAGRISVPFMGAYSASKFALEAMSDALRLELAPFGVHVVLIEPGPISTHFGRTARSVAEDNPASPYARYNRGVSGAKSISDLFTRPADSVARTVVRAVSSSRPRPRYTITLNAKLGTLGRRLVPDVLMDWAMRLAMGLR